MATTPKVEDLATLHYPSDLYPYVVVAVSPTGSKVKLERIERAATAPARFTNGFPVWDCDGDPNKRVGLIDIAHRNAAGKYAVGGSTPVSFGRARYYRDYSE